jgi:hypothetical protein
VGGVGGVTPCWRNLPGPLYVLAAPCDTTSAPCGARARAHPAWSWGPIQGCVRARREVDVGLTDQETATRPPRAPETKRAAQHTRHIRACGVVGDAGRAARRSAVAVADARNRTAPLRMRRGGGCQPRRDERAALQEPAKERGRRPHENSSFTAHALAS